ncbi:restriction endonuclease subunit S [Salinibacter sp.]|uniref:restriction endonuclease subunit S n=1 Tax=Salinibacter sp. TaxID=2065818 RepID=UPI0021E91099|nr:restriction endonuclease subunit S [Salinibacter sp.]
MTFRTLLDRFDLLLDTPESVPKLRQFILQLAVRGQLTERRPSDTPADELLESIRKEKEQLYDEGAIRKSQAKLPEIAEDAESLPNGWISVELERVGVVNPRHDADEGVKASFVPMKRIEDGVGDGHSTEIRPWGEIRRGYTHFMEGDVGLAKITPCFQNRKSTVFRDLKNGIGAGTTELYVFRPLANTILPEFVLSFFQSQGFIEEGVRRMTGTAGQKRVPREYVEQSLLPLPPLSEQQRIVERVDRLMDECDELEQHQERERTLQVQVGTSATEALQSAGDAEALRPAWERVREHFDTVTATSEGVDALRQTILQLALQGRLTERDPDDTAADELLEQIQKEKQRLYDAGEIRKPKDLPPVTDPPDNIPSHWVWTRVGEVTGMQGGYAFKSSWYEDEGVRLVRNTNISHGYIDWSDTARLPYQQANEFERFQLNRGDILLSLDRPIISTGLKVARVTEEDLPALLVQRVGRFELEVSAIDEDYFFFWLHSPHFLEGIDPGRSNAIPHISQKEVLRLAFPLPPLSEQKRIVKVLNRLFPLCEDLYENVTERIERGEELLMAATRDMSLDQSVLLSEGQPA